MCGMFLEFILPFWFFTFVYCSFLPHDGLMYNIQKFTSVQTKDLKGISIDLLVPGMMVNASVRSTLENGIMLSFLTYFTGTVSLWCSSPVTRVAFYMIHCFHLLIFTLCCYRLTCSICSKLSPL